MFYEKLSILISKFSSQEIQSFWQLLLVGKSSFEEANSLGRLFFEMGLIHLLVLSGSQISHFRNLILFPMGMLSKLLGASKSGWIWLTIKFLVFSILIFYVYDVGEAAPLVRAMIFLSLREVGFISIESIKKTYLIPLMALMIHMSIYPEHLSSLSFYLSWVSFLSLSACSRMKCFGQMSLIFVVSLICQMAVHQLKSIPPPEWSQLLVGSSVNVLLIPLFEKIIFPTGAILLLGALWMLILPEASWGERLLCWIFDSFGFIFEIPVNLVLGVLSGIRYI